MSGTLVITMAGFGSRFQKAGYTVPKYMIEAHGRSLFEWSMISLERFRRAGWQTHLILRAADQSVPWLCEKCRLLGIEEPGMQELDAPTDGQATTALLAGPHLQDRGAGFLIYNIDTFVMPHALVPECVRGDGWVPCADLPGDAWSFARTEDDLRAVELREKKRISNHATIGLYYFASFALYHEIYDAFYAENANVEAGERYIAPMYNHMIAGGHDVYVEVVPRKDFFALGTPSDVEAFLKQPSVEILV